MSDPKLAQVFKFDETDLQYNRQGALSPRQQGGYDKSNRGCLFSAAIFTMMFTILTIAMGAAFGKDAIVGLIVLGIFTVLGWIGTYAIWSSRNDPYPMGQIEGQALLRMDNGRNGEAYIVNINGYEFDISPDAYEVLESGATYHVYYAIIDGMTDSPKTAMKEIKSIERLA